MQTMLPVILRFFSFGIGDFAIDLRERFKAAHGEQGMAKRNDHGDNGIVGQIVP